MVKKRWLIGIFAAFLLAFLIFCNISDCSAYSPKISQQVYSELHNSSKARVIIELNSQKPSAPLSSMAASNSVRNVIGNKNINNDLGNVLSAYISNSQLQSLQNNSDVKSIRLEGVKHILLQQSVPLINGTITWQLQQNGFNLTGIGQTVCIIDTGVNYTHSDLGGCYGNNNASSSCKVIGGYNFINNSNPPMDDHGHGTHIAGIIAASGGITGVAPGAKIVALKACDSSGSCDDGNVMAAIDWCVNNATIFNISVISISLGGKYVYSSYCDANTSEDSELYAPYINSAIAKNISVVIASGNGINNAGPGIPNNISSPACIQNATAVGSTSKNDSISSFSDRWGLGNFVFAPGENINSTWINGLYAPDSGTSMATPHVAAAVAIINEYLKLTNQSKAPSQILFALNKTGKAIYDSASNLNFSRINVYNAVISFDNQSPNVTLVSPNNSYASSTLNQTFICNATDLALQNASFYLWNSTGAVYNLTLKNASGQADIFSLNITNISMGVYTWNCLYTDKDSNIGFANSNFTIYVWDPAVNLDYPLNNSIAAANQNFTCDGSSSVILRNATFYLWNSTGIANTTAVNLNGTANTTSFNYTFTSQSQDNYKWNCLFVNNKSNQSFAPNNFSIIYDITPPNVSLPVQYQNQTSSSAVETFYYNATDNLNIANCSLIINNSINLTSSSINQSILNNFTQTFSPGDYAWSINCTDFGNNAVNSSQQSFTISAPAPPSTNGGGNSGGGGGGGGGGPASQNITYIASSADLMNGFTSYLNVGDKIDFPIGNENHTLTLQSIADNSASLIVESNRIGLYLQSGESANISLTSPSYYDLLIKLNSISNSRANLTITSINEPVTSTKHILLENITNSTKVGSQPAQNKGYGKYLVWLLIVALIVILILLSMRGKIKNKSHGKQYII